MANSRGEPGSWATLQPVAPDPTSGNEARAWAVGKERRPEKRFRGRMSRVGECSCWGGRRVKESFFIMKLFPGIRKADKKEFWRTKADVYPLAYGKGPVIGPSAVIIRGCCRESREVRRHAAPSWNCIGPALFLELPCSSYSATGAMLLSLTPAYSGLREEKVLFLKLVSGIGLQEENISRPCLP